MSRPQPSLAGARASAGRPWFLAPEVERVLAISMTIAQELAVARARIDTLERLLERKGVLARSELETFEPAAADAAERSQWNQEYIARMLRVLRQEGEPAADCPGGDRGSTDSAQAPR